MKRRLLPWLCVALALLGGARSSPGAAIAPNPDLVRARGFWSFRPIVSPPVPVIDHPAMPVNNPIDAFVLAKLAGHGLSPAPPASRRELARRVTFDLTGLPPAPQDIAAFEADASPEAWTRLTERLLESPHFGERWAQHWLDVVRYAESEGFEYDRHLPGAWRYRDYVIDAFRRDKPYDQFVTEQLAGDEEAPGDTEGARAAIFHRLGPVRRNAGNPEIALSRNEVLTERTDVIGSAFLGLTLGCARCHDHKLDPISQKDYYRLQAYVAGTQEDDRVLASAEERKAWEERTKSVQAELKRARQALETAEGSARGDLKARIDALEATLPPPLPTVPTVREDAEGRTAIHVLKRGEWERKGERVGPRPPGVLVPDDLPEGPPDLARPRADLARWLTDPAHPLTARVIVNRLWQHHFGTGLVRTPNDFGQHGERPSHPELLDWLAAELIRGGWRLKPIHRLILASSTYRQSSTPRAQVMQAGARLDPGDRWLWHFPVRRLSAEEIRDAMLAVAGRLNRKLGGPSVMVPVDPELVQLLYKPAQWEVTRDEAEHSRRSIYLVAKRNLRLPFLEVFDQPALLTSCGRRESSTHAPQALELLNGRFANELARDFAARLERDAGPSTSDRVRLAYQLALGRPPNADEAKLAREFLKHEPLSEFALAVFNLHAFLHVY